MTEPGGIGVEQPPRGPGPESESGVEPASEPAGAPRPHAADAPDAGPGVHPGSIRWPAEWEPHATTWVTWPHSPETWPGRHLAGAEKAFVAMARALAGAGRETLCVAVRDPAHEEGARSCLRGGGVDPDRGIRFYRVPTDDGWMRDCGPIFVWGRVSAGPGWGRERGRGPGGTAQRAGGGRAAEQKEAPERARGAERARAVPRQGDPGAGAEVLMGVDFAFDAWGGKYPPWERDAAVGAAVCAAAGAQRLEVPLVLEGGAIDGDGRGTVLTTESCLLHPNRGAGRSREALEEALGRWLGARCVLWLGAGIEGDDTDGHVDDIARFVGPGTVVAAVERDPTDPNAGPLAENLRRLRRMRDAEGKPLAVAELPMPPAREVAGQRCPASYANFYLANGVVLVPVFGAPSDARALAVLRELLPQREVVAIPSEDLVVGLGAIHCVTQQQPSQDAARR